MEKRFTDLLRQYVTPFLKACEFKKHGCNFIANKGELLWIISFQRSWLNSHKKIEFTVNCGLIIPGVVSTFFSKPPNKKFSLTDSCIYIRIGMLTENKLDIWWTIEEENDIKLSDEAISKELIEMIANFVFPFLNRFTNARQVAEFLESENNILRLVDPLNPAIRHSYAAIIYSKLNDTEKKRSALEKAIQYAKETPLESKIESIAKITGAMVG